MKLRKFERGIIDIAREIGFTNIRVSRRARHPMITADDGDRTISYVFSGTSGDGRADKNITADLRKLKS